MSIILKAGIKSSSVRHNVFLQQFFSIKGHLRDSWTVWAEKNHQMSITLAQKWFHHKNDRFRLLYKISLRMWEIWANWLLPKCFLSCPKSNIAPDLVTPQLNHHAVHANCLCPSWKGLERPQARAQYFYCTSPGLRFSLHKRATRAGPGSKYSAVGSIMF